MTTSKRNARKHRPSERKVRRQRLVFNDKPLVGDSDIYFTVLRHAIIRSRHWLGEELYQRLHGNVRARDCLALIKTAELLEIQQYSSGQDLFVKAQLVALIKKYPFTREEAPGFDPELAAWKKFLAAEHRCKRVNQRFAALRYGDGFAYGDVMSTMRHWIRSVLGESPDYERIYDLCNFGPGASVGVGGDYTNMARKFLAGQWSVTRAALSLSVRALWQHEQFRTLILGPGIVCLDYDEFRSRVTARTRLVTHNNINFVPKTFKTHRSIASEPLLNGYLQKGIDQVMRERLAHVGLDLRDQSRNSTMAKEGSRGGFNPYVTIDLTSASDSLPYAVVKSLIPPEWFDLLDRTRSHMYRYEGKVYPYSKFVSMGNGFCFPLQTLLFAAVCYAVSVRHGSPIDFRVYGDDIVVRQSDAAVVLEILKHLGFRNNPDKSFFFGLFRESCGTDWYSGQDVRPVYLDFRFRTTRDLYKFHNSTLRSQRTKGLFPDARTFLRECASPESAFLRPYHGSPDTAFTVDRDTFMSCKFATWDRNLWAWRWREAISAPVRDKLEGHDPRICSELEYLAVLRGSSSKAPLAVRRKAKVSIRRKTGWGLPGEMTWLGACDTGA